MSLVWEHSQATLGARLVLLALADYAHDDGGGAYPSMDSLADKAKMTKRNVQLAMRRLEAMGEIVAEGYHVSGARQWRILVTQGGEKSSSLGAKIFHGGGEKNDTNHVENFTLTVNEPSESATTDVVARDARVRTGDFEQFWRLYPRQNRGPKDKARAAWIKLSDAQRWKAINGLANWAGCDQWQRGLVNRCDRWLSGEMYDELPPAATKTNGRLDETHAVKSTLDYLDEQATRAWHGPVATNVGYDDDGALAVEWEQR